MSIGNLVSDAAFLLANHPILQRLIAASIELAVLFVATTLLVRATRSRAPRLVQMLWLVVLIKPLVSVCTGSVLPLVRLDPLAPVVSTADSASSLDVASFPMRPRRAGVPIAVAAVGDERHRLAAPIPPRPVPEPPPARLLTADGLARGATWTWIGGTLLAAALYLGGRGRLSRHIRRALPTPPAVEREYRDLVDQMGMDRAPPIVVTDALESPALAGVLLPRILVPTWLASERAGPKLRWALRHELTHWKCHDPVSVLVRDAVRIVFWFHPAARLSGRRLTDAMELACDQSVVSDTSQCTDYAEQLVTILENVGDRQRAPAASALFATRAQVGKRIAALLDGTSKGPQLTTFSVIGLLAFATAALAIGGIATALPTGGTDGNGARILQFARDRSLGRLQVQDTHLVRKIENFHHWIDGISEAWVYLGEAQGTVTIPPGKRVRLAVGQDAWRDLRPLTLLPPDAIYELSVAYIPADDRCMEPIGRLTGLKVLDLRSSNIGDAGLRHLRKLTSLERLHTPNGLTDAGMIHVGQLRSLRGLYLDSNRVTNTGLAQLANLTGLEEVRLGGRLQDAAGKTLPSLMTDAGLVYLSKLPDLWYVLLWGDFTDDAMAHMRAIRSLHTLNLSHLNITDNGLRHLAGCTKLEALDLYDTKVTDAGLVHLKALPSLKLLDLMRPVNSYDFNKPPITDAGAAILKEIRTLEHLNVPFGSLTAVGLAHLAELDRLRFLWAQGPKTGDAELKQIGRMKSLESLLLGGEAFSLEGLTCIAGLRKLQTLNISAQKVDPEAFPLLAKLPALESLNVLSSQRNIGISAANSFSGAPRLKRLEIGLLERDGGTLELKDLPQLEVLKLSMERGEPLNDDDIACVADMKNLRTLAFGMLGTGPADITDAGMTHVSGLTSLERLYISGRGITDRGLAEVAGLHRLRDLGLAGAFSDAGLRHLEPLHGLTRVAVRSSGAFSPAALERLRTALPHARQLNVEQNRDMGSSRHREKTLAVGDPAPPFDVTTIDGTKTSLSDYQGKTVLLHFWGTWCAPCMASTRGLKLFHATLSKDCPGFAMVSFAMDDDSERFRDCIQKEGFPWPQARVGLNSKIAAAYGVEGAPSYFVIGPDGAVGCMDKDWNKIAAAVRKLANAAPQS